MKDYTKYIMERHQVRKTKKQKAPFIKYIEKLASEWGYHFEVESGRFGSKNLVVGDIGTAKAVYSAHYDTPAVCPFPNFITPSNLTLFIFYNVLCALVFFLVPSFILSGSLELMLERWFHVDHGIASFVSRIVFVLFYITECFLLLFGPANKHTANDNTSGVTLLLEIMESMPQNMRSDVAFVFFDKEELGLIGSASFYRKHGNIMKNKLLINFDCVGDGKSFIFILRCGAKPYAELIKKAFTPCEGYEISIKSKGVFYPSDQKNFPAGVGVAALNTSRFLKIKYMNKIHTRRDRVCDEKNIRLLAGWAVSFTALLCEEQAGID